MVPTSHFYLDREPPNAAAVRASMQRKSAPAATTPLSASTSYPPTLDVGGTTAEGAMAVPTESTGASLPPTPAAKDTPKPDYKALPEEGVEAELHPQADDVEGPVTTTVAVPASEGAAPADEAGLAASESNGGLSTASEDKLDEISLGGGDEEEVDLS